MSEVVEEKLVEVEVAVNVETSLHYYLGRTSGNYLGQASGESKSGVVIREAALKGHLNLRGNPENELFLRGVSEVLGVKLPTEPGSHVSTTGVSVYWLGPTEWLVIVDGGAEMELETQLRKTLHGHLSIVDVSGGQTLINLSGEGVEYVLKKSSGYDFHSSRFRVGRCVQTTFAKAGALVSKREDGSFDLVIRRSFADYLAKWLLDAGREFGCRIEKGSV